MAKGSFIAKARGRRKRARASTSGGRKGSRHRRGRNRASGPIGGSKFNLFGLDLVGGLVGGAGAVGSGMATNWAASMVPVEQLKSGPGKLALRAALTIAAAMLAKKALPPRISNPLIGGAVVGLGIDVLQTFVLPNVPGMPALSGYEPIEEQLAAIVAADPNALNGLVAIDGSGFRLPTLAGY